MPQLQVSRYEVDGKPYTQIEKLLMRTGVIDRHETDKTNALA